MGKALFSQVSVYISERGGGGTYLLANWGGGVTTFQLIEGGLPSNRQGVPTFWLIGDTYLGGYPHVARVGTHQAG